MITSNVLYTFSFSLVTTSLGTQRTQTQSSLIPKEQERSKFLNAPHYQSLTHNINRDLPMHPLRFILSRLIIMPPQPPSSMHPKHSPDHANVSTPLSLSQNSDEISSVEIMYKDIPETLE